MHACHPRTWVVGGRGSEILGHLYVHSNFEASLGCMRPSLQNSIPFSCQKKKKKFKCTLGLLPKTLCDLFHYTHSTVFSTGGFVKSKYPLELRLQTALKEWGGRQGTQSHSKPHCLAWHLEGFLCSNSSPFLSV